MSSKTNISQSLKGKGKGICSESIYPCDSTCSSDLSSPGSRRTAPCNYWSNFVLDLDTRYPLRLGGPRQYGIQSLPDTSTHGKHWESSPRLSDLESNTLSTRPHVPLKSDQIKLPRPNWSNELWSNCKQQWITAVNEQLWMQTTKSNVTCDNPVITLSAHFVWTNVDHSVLFILVKVLTIWRMV